MNEKFKNFIIGFFGAIGGMLLYLFGKRNGTDVSNITKRIDDAQEQLNECEKRTGMARENIENSLNIIDKIERRNKKK